MIFLQKNHKIKIKAKINAYKQIKTIKFNPQKVNLKTNIIYR